MSNQTVSAEAVMSTQPANLQTIVRRFADVVVQTRRLSSTQRKALWSIANCRTPAMGGHLEHCERCQFVRYQYHSCRTRHCPQCQSQASAQWQEARMQELLPVPYFHHVFTLPHNLNPWVLRSQRNYRALIKLLFQSASETLLQFGQENLGGRVGVSMILHTWDQRLNPHFHVHCLVPSGALCDGGTRWRAGGRKFLFPVKALSKVFRAKFLDGLKKLIVDFEIDVPDLGVVLANRVRDGNERHLSKHFRGPWVVYAQRPFAGPKKLLNYLSRYVHRTAISNERIVSVNGNEVQFSYRDRANGDRKKTETLTGEAFLCRFLLHILPKGLMRIRHYGFLANRNRKKNLAHCRELLGAISPPPEDVRSMKEWFFELTGLDLTRCPNCDAQLMRIEFPPMQHSKETLSQIPPRHPALIDSS